MAKSQVFGRHTETLSLQYDPDLQSWKMSLLFEAEGLIASSETWPASGMMRLIRYSTPSSWEARSVDVEFTSWPAAMDCPPEPIYSTVQSVLNLTPPPKSQLSSNAVNAILRRSREHDLPLPSFLASALISLQAAQ